MKMQEEIYQTEDPQSIIKLKNDLEEYIKRENNSKENDTENSITQDMSCLIYKKD